MVTENGIGPGDRVRVQHQFAIANVPSDAGIAQQARSENPAGHGHQQDDENQIGRPREREIETTPVAAPATALSGFYR